MRYLITLTLILSAYAYIYYMGLSHVVDVILINLLNLP